MSNDIIFFTQVGSIVAFIFALFGLYRSLVDQKDSLIELLREQRNVFEKQKDSVIELLREQVKDRDSKVRELEDKKPDVLAKVLSDRIAIFENELNRLKKDKDGDKNKEKIWGTKIELQYALTMNKALLTHGEVGMIEAATNTVRQSAEKNENLDKYYPLFKKWLDGTGGDDI